MKTFMMMILSVLSLLTAPVLSINNNNNNDKLVSIHPHGCDNEMMTKMCHSNTVNTCYSCIRFETDVEVCVPVFNNHHREYKNPLDRFPSSEWNCTIHRHEELKPENNEEDDIEEFIDVLGEVLEELDEVEEILQNERHFMPHSSFSSSFFNGCGGEKLKCMLHKNCRNFIKKLKECNNDIRCIVQLISGTNDEHFLRLVECMSV